MNTPPPSSKEENILPQPLLNSLSSLSTNEILPSLRVFVRSPSDTLPNNFSVPIDQNSTVKDLKLFLATEHPQKPKPEDQRLIFCGKLLEEDTRIYDLLKKCDLSVSQTFHLVVRHASTDNLSTSNTSTPSRIPASPIPPHPTPSSAPPLPPFHQNEPFTPFQHSTTTSSPSEIVLNGIRYQHVRINGLPYLMSLPYPHYAGDPTPTIPGDALPGRQPDPLQAAMRPARQGNGSSVQLAIKIAVLLLIFCRNASIERVVLMHIAALVIFLHQTGRLRVVRGRVLPNGDIALVRNEGQAVAGTRNNDNPNNPNNPNNTNGGENGGSAVAAMLQGVWAFISSMVPSNEVEE